MLKEQTLFGERDKVKEAIEVLQDLEPKEGYYLADSGGKDSAVILALTKMSGVKFDSHHNLTTIDPPEVIYHIRDHHKETTIDKPEIPLLEMLIKKGFPQRQRRWCCALYKERGGEGRLVITGIRAAESHKRAGRRMVEACYKGKGKGKRYLNIIFGWSKTDVWDFIHKYNIPYCKLYDQGFDRIGCLMCPMAGKHRQIEAKRYPRYVRNFIKAFEKMYEKKKSEGKTSVDRWKNGEEMFYWWLEEPKESEDPDQTVMFE